MESKYWNQQLSYSIQSSSQPGKIYPSIRESADEYETQLITKTPRQEWHFLSMSLGYWRQADMPDFISMLDPVRPAASGSENTSGYLVLEFISTSLTPNYYEAIGVLGKDNMHQEAENEYLKQLTATIQNRQPRYELSFIPRMFMLIKVVFGSTPTTTTGNADMVERNKLFLESLSTTNTSTKLSASKPLEFFLPNGTLTSAKEVQRVNVQVRTRTMEGNTISMNHSIVMFDPAAYVLNIFPATSSEAIQPPAFGETLHDPFSQLRKSATNPARATSASSFPVGFNVGASSSSATVPVIAPRDASLPESESSQYLGESYIQEGNSNLNGMKVDPNKKYDVNVEVTKRGDDEDGIKQKS